MKGNVARKGARKGQFVKGDPRAGRPKGSKNKLTGELKDLILQALAQAGGVAYLRNRALDSPAPFIALLGRVLPIQQQHSGADGAPLTVIQRITTREPGD